MHASNPSQHKTFGLNILQFYNSKELKIKCFEFMIFNLYNPLQDWSIIFGIGIDFTFYTLICLSLIHISLNVHYFLKYIVNIWFSIIFRIKVNMIFPQSL
jgi:hypothetical protein